MSAVDSSSLPEVRREVRVIEIPVTGQPELDAFLVKTIANGNRSWLKAEGPVLETDGQLWVGLERIRNLLGQNGFPSYSEKLPAQLFHALDDYLNDCGHKATFGFHFADGELEEIELHSLDAFLSQHADAIPGIGSTSWAMVQALIKLGEANRPRPVAI